MREYLTLSIHRLQQDIQASVAPQSLQDQLVTSGRQQVLSELQAIAPEAPDVHERVKILLEKHWERSKSTPLMYTVSPKCALTRVCCKLALAVVDATLKGTQKPHVLDILMPGLTTASALDTFPDLEAPEEAPQAWLEALLSTHITRKDGSCLIPIKLLTRASISASEERIHNPYVDTMSSNTDDYYVSDDELKRLMAHSNYTQAVRDKKNYLKTLEAGGNTFLAHINYFLHQLHIYSAQGLGEETNAAGGAYPAIINFMAYYQALPENIQSEIPPDVKKEIDLIFNLSSDATQNTNATEQIETCTATRRTELRKAVQQHKQALSLINSSNLEHAEHIHQAELALESAENEFDHALAQHTYEGKDSVAVTSSALKQFNIDFSIEREADFEAIAQLSIKEINELFTDEANQQVVLNYLNKDDTGVGKLIILAIASTPEKFAAILHQLESKLTSEHAILSTPEHLSALLVSLSNEHIEHICRIINKDLIKTISDFEKMVYPLEPEQRTVVYQLMQDHLENLIRSLEDIGLLLGLLTPEQCAKMFNEMLEANISADAFIELFEYIPSEQQEAVAKSVVARLPHIIHNGHDFRCIMQCLEPEHQNALFDFMRKFLPDVIQDGANFFEASCYLTPEQKIIFYEDLKEHFPKMIQNAEDLKWVLKALTPEQCINACELIKQDLSHLLPSDDHRNKLLESFEHGQRDTVSKILKEIASKQSPEETFKAYKANFETLTDNKTKPEAKKEEKPQKINNKQSPS